MAVHAADEGAACQLTEDVPPSARRKCAENRKRSHNNNGTGCHKKGFALMAFAEKGRNHPGLMQKRRGMMPRLIFFRELGTEREGDRF